MIALVLADQRPRDRFRIEHWPGLRALEKTRLKYLIALVLSAAGCGGSTAAALSARRRGRQVSGAPVLLSAEEAQIGIRRVVTWFGRADARHQGWNVRDPSHRRI